MRWIRQIGLAGVGLCLCLGGGVVHAYDAKYAQALAAYHQMLQNTVKAGRVDYALVKSAPALSEYLQALAKVPASLTGSEKKALYINAYNAFTLQLIVDYWPDIKSIKDIPDNFFSGYRRWDDERWTLAGEKVSLNQLEHKMLRPMGDARIHFAIVCASISCPDLQAFAFQAETLDAQLDTVAKGFLADPDKGLVLLDKRVPSLKVSKIFSWFEADFERDAGTVYAYLIRYSDEQTAKRLKLHQGSLDLDHLDYDWGLNQALP